MDIQTQAVEAVPSTRHTLTSHTHMVMVVLVSCSLPLMRVDVIDQFDLCCFRFGCNSVDPEGNPNVK